MKHDDALAEGNPLEPDTARDQRIRERAYHMWEADGCPEGNDLEYWERARQLEAIADNPTAGLLPIDSPEYPEEASLQDNLGEVPGRLTDQGDRRQTPLASENRGGKVAAAG